MTAELSRRVARVPTAQLSLSTIKPRAPRRRGPFLRGWRGATDAAFVQHDDAVAHAHELGQLARAEDDRFPGVGKPIDDLVDFNFRADIDAARGLVEEDDLRLGHERFAEHDFLLIAAGEFAGDGFEAGRFDAERAEGVIVLLELAARIDEAGTGQARGRGEREVESDGLVEHGAVPAAVFAHERESAAQDFRGRQRGKLAAAELDAAAAPFAPGAEEMHEQLGAARAHEAAKSEDFTGRDAEGDVAEAELAGVRIGDAEVLHAQH